MADVEDEVIVTKSGKFEGDTGRIFDIDEFGGDKLYLVHMHMPHDRTVELYEGDFEVMGDDLSLASEGITSDGDAFEWLDGNVDDKIQIITNSEGYTLHIRLENGLNGTVEERALFSSRSVSHEQIRGVRPRSYENKKRGETLRDALAKHFEELEPDASVEKDVERHADKTGKMDPEEVLREYSSYYDYDRLFIES